MEDFENDLDFDAWDNKAFEHCPACGREYDEIDYEYQICHHCKYEVK